MSQYGDNDEWGLTDAYNTRRGEVLDGSSVSPTPSVKWNTGKHCVDDNSIHYKIMNFLKTQPMKKASIRILKASLNIDNLDHYLRELKKQLICKKL
jgi:hypothetical protein